jgi:hypothetical protein
MAQSFPLWVQYSRGNSLESREFYFGPMMLSVCKGILRMDLTMINLNMVLSGKWIDKKRELSLRQETEEILNK